MQVRDRHPAPALGFTCDAALLLPDRLLILCNDGSRGHIDPRLHSLWFRREANRNAHVRGDARLDGGSVLHCSDDGWLVGLKNVLVVGEVVVTG